MSRFLVTGGAGFIGSNLAIELERLGHEVVIADHRPPVASFECAGNFVAIDVTTPLDLNGPFHAVFHQASLTDPRYQDDKAMMEQNVSGFANVAAFAQRKSAKLVYASTAGLYGNLPVPMREDQKPECLTAYGRSKLKIEGMAGELESHIPIVGLRYFNVFGPRESIKGRPASMIYHLSRQMKAGRRPRLFKSGEQRRDHIYIPDVVRANLLALDAPSGVYNVGTGVGTSFRDLVQVLNELMGTDLAPEYFDMPFDPQTYQHHTVADTTLAVAKLGFRASWSLSDAIGDYLAWLDAGVR